MERNDQYDADAIGGRAADEGDQPAERSEPREEPAQHDSEDTNDDDDSIGLANESDFGTE